jgi:hypothetical protein
MGSPFIRRVRNGPFEKAGRCRYYCTVPKPPTYYANIVNLKTTATELVLDFSCMIEQPKPQAEENIGQAEQQVPKEPEVRIILVAGVVRAFANLLVRAAEQQEAAAGKASAPTGTESNRQNVSEKA